jgi:hypothetical protein
MSLPEREPARRRFINKTFKVVAKSGSDLLNANPAQPEKGLEVQLDGMGEQEGDGASGWVTFAPCMVQWHARLPI